MQCGQCGQRGRVWKEVEAHSTHLPDRFRPLNLQVSRAAGTGLRAPAWPLGELWSLIMRPHTWVRLFQLLLF